MFIESMRFFCAVLIVPLSVAAQTGKPIVSSCQASAIFTQAKEFLLQKHYEESARLLDQLKNCPGLSPLETLQWGWLYGRARQFEAALKIFDRVPPGVPDPLTHAYAIALCKFELSDYRGAISTLEVIRASGLSDVNTSNLLAVSYSKLALYKQAYAVLSRQLEKDPNDFSTYLNLVTVCAEGGDLAKAAQVAQEAAKLFPHSPEVLVVRGATRSLLGQSLEAAQDFASALHLAPGRPDIRFFLALMAYNEAHFSEAAAIIEKAYRDGLQDSDLHYLMAETLLKTDAANSDAALAELDYALRLNPKSAAALTLRGRLLLDKGRPQEALAQLEAAQRNDPGSRSAIYNLARAYRVLGKKEQAELLFDELRSEQPDTLHEMSTRRFGETLADKGAPQ